MSFPLNFDRVFENVRVFECGIPIPPVFTYPIEMPSSARRSVRVTPGQISNGSSTASIQVREPAVQLARCKRMSGRPRRQQEPSKCRSRCRKSLLCSMGPGLSFCFLLRQACAVQIYRRLQKPLSAFECRYTSIAFARYDLPEAKPASHLLNCALCIFHREFGKRPTFCLLRKPLPFFP